MSLASTMKGFDEAALSRGEEYSCYTCKDWGTVVIEDANENPISTEPCPDCQPVRRQAWLEEKEQEASRNTPTVGDLVVVKSVCQLCTVELEPTPNTDDGAPLVLVRSLAGGVPWWVALNDVEKVSAEVAGL